MNKQLSDEQIDKLMRTMLSEAAIDDDVINEIADSPKLWWGVQRQITTQKAESPWPPSIWRRVLLFAAPVAVAAALVISFFVLGPVERKTDVATTPQPSSTSSQNEGNVTQPALDEMVESPKTTTMAKSMNQESTQAKSIHASARTSSGRSSKGTTIAKATKSPEFKSEFIALSYARNAESGQIVRVRVPSSMMVSLGLVSSVNKSSDLVDAEVIVGDDGLTRAIRFIR